MHARVMNLLLRAQSSSHTIIYYSYTFKDRNQSINTPNLRKNWERNRL